MGGLKSRRAALILVLVAVVSLVSGCTQGDSPVPTAGVPTTGVPTTTGAAVDAWGALHDAQQGCPKTPMSSFVVPGSPVKALTSVSDCAVLLARIDTSVAVWSPSGLMTFPGVSVGIMPSFLVPVPDGFWIAAYDATAEKPFLRLMRGSAPTEVVLPGDLAVVSAAAPYRNGLVVAGDVTVAGRSTTDPRSVVLSVAGDGTVVPLKTFDHGGVGGIAADGDRIVVGVVSGGVVSVAYGDGKTWKTKSFGEGDPIIGVAVKQDTIVVMYHEQQLGVVVSLVTETSRDGGATWTRTADPGGYGYRLLGFWGDTPLGVMYMPDSPVMLFTLASSDSWEPLAVAPVVTPEGTFDAALAPCGVWVWQDGSLSYVPLSTDCVPS